MVILVAGEKGGVGKSTIAVSLASLRALAGHDVLIIDTDTQGSASMWGQIRVSESIDPTVTCITKRGRDLPDAIRDLATRYEDILVDAGGRDSIEMRAALTVCDVAMLPLGGSLFDLGTVDTMSQLVEQASVFNHALKAKIFLNRASPNPLVSEVNQAREMISEYGNLELMNTVIRDRIAFRRSILNGRCVVEMANRDSSAVAELTGLYEEVYDEEYFPAR